MSNKFIHGLQRENRMLNGEEIGFLNNLGKRITNAGNYQALPNLRNEEISNKLKVILDKISSLSFIQDNIHEIFDGYDLTNSESIKKLFKNFDFKSMIQNPNVLNQYIFENKITGQNKQKFSNKSYINTQNINTTSKIGKSVLIFFFILKKMVEYIKMKKKQFDDLIKSGRVNNISKVNSNKLAKAIKAYKGFEFLMKKFLKAREKIFSITQLQYVEEPLPKDTIISNDYFFYYHFFKEVIDGVLLHYNIIPKPLKKYSELNTFLINNKIVFNENNIKILLPQSRRNSVITLPFIFNFENNPLYEINIKPDNANIQINKNKVISSVLYIKEANNVNNSMTIISKRNKSYVIFEYVISANDNRIIQSKKPKLIEFDKNKNNDYGEIFLISYYK